MQRWMSVDKEDGDTVREVAATDKLPGTILNFISFNSEFYLSSPSCLMMLVD